MTAKPDRTGESAQRRFARRLLFCAAASLALLSPAISGQGRSERVLEGTLEVHYEDRADGARLTHFLNTGTERIPLRFSGKLPDRRLLTGSRVRVRGQMSNNVLALGDGPGGPGMTTVALASTNTFGPQSTLVILFNFLDLQTQPFTTATAQSVTFTDVNNFDLENSFGQTSLAGTVTGWYTISAISTSCNYTNWAALADAAANANVNVASYPRRVYAFPATSACAWYGLASVGGGTVATPSRAWINGNYTLQVVAHEMGHNFGLYHSHSNTCDSSGCAVSEYGDDHDVMGNYATGHFNAYQKERLGWLNHGTSPPIQEVSAAGAYTLEPYETAAAGLPKAIEIFKSTSGGFNTYLYAEARTQTGVDAALTPGVLIHSGVDTDGNQSQLQDVLPTTTGTDFILDPGQSVTFTGDTSPITLTTLSANNAGAVVAVTASSVPCVYSLGSSGQSMVAGGGSGSVTLTTTSDCYRNATSNASWMTLNAGSTNGLGPATIQFTVAANTSSLPRVGTVSITGQTYTVTQSGVPCAYDVSPASEAFNYSAGGGIVSVTAAPSDCAWSAVSNDTSWVTITAGASGSGSGSVTYSVLAKSPAVGSRTTTITVAGQTVTITQAGHSDTTLSPVTASGPYGGTTALSATLTAGTSSVGSGRAITFRLNGTVVGTANTNSSGVATLSNATLAGIAIGSYATGVSASFAGNSTFNASSGTSALTVTQGTPTINWSTPASIASGTALSGTQLNATANTPGTFVYTPAAGTVLSAGVGQTLSVTFTPTDTTDYTTATASVPITVFIAPGGSYTTEFPLTENPTSEGGIWTNGKATGVDWSNTRTTPGLAFGTQTGSVNFTDSIAVLPGTWGANQTVTATVHTVNQQSGSVFEEVELLLRFSIGAHSARGYELNFSCRHDGTQYAQVVRWNGSVGGFTVLNAQTGPGLHDGDQVKATIVGNTITTYINNVALFSVTDSTYASGSPGMGFYLQGGTAALAGDYGFTSYSASDGGSGPGAPGVPTPTDGATDLSTTPTLTWTAAGATSYDVYFGTTSTPPSVSIGQASSTYTPAGPLVVGTPYYWRVVAHSSGGTTLGPVWSFTTTPKTSPTITWSTPASITYGTPLSATQLNATANVPGTFVYTPAAGTVLSAGAGQTLSVTFTPTDNVTYSTATASAFITIAKATPAIAWSTPASITYGTLLSGTQLNATAGVPGTFVYTPAAGTVLDGGVGQTLSVTFTPTDTANYASAVASTLITVTKAAPTITWTTPANIVYGTALSATQLNATASVPGSFVYTPATGTVLNAGAGQTLSVTFTPTDATDHSTATTTVPITVATAAPAITWATPANIVYGTALSATQLNATANVPGSFVYTPAAGTLLNAGVGQTLSVSFTPTDTTDYASATANVPITVTKATPTITWNTPTSITYPTPLNGTQLNATASVPGTFVYTPAAGTVVLVGAAQTLLATFTPTDTADYTTATGSVALTVRVGVPSSPTPADGAINVSRTPALTWTAAGSSPPPQHIQTIKKSAASVSSITTNPLVASAGSSLILSAGAFSDGAAVPAISSVKLDGVTDFTIDKDVEANVSGSYHLRNTVGSLPGVSAGSHTVTVTYAGSVSNVTVFLTEVAGLAVAAPLDGSGSSATGTSATPASGMNTPAASSDYWHGSLFVLAVGSPPTISATSGWTIPANGKEENSSLNLAGSIEYNSAPGSTSENATWVVTDSTVGWVASAVAYKTVDSTSYDVNFGVSPSPPTVSTGQSTAAYTPGPLAASTTYYWQVTARSNAGPTAGPVWLLTTVPKVTPTITWATPASIPYGTALSATQLNATASVPGTFVYTPAAGTVLGADAGQTLSATFTPTDTADYTPATAGVAIAVTQVTPTITWATPASIPYGTALGATHLNATASVPGTFVYTPAAGTVLAVGAGHVLSVAFTPTDTANYAATTATTTVAITPAIVMATVTAANKVYDGTTAASLTSCVLTGTVGGDSLNCTGGPATFASAAAGSGKAVTVTGLSLSGAAAGNYQLSSTTATTTAAITTVTVTVTVTALSKPYDGTTAATLASCTPVGLVANDVLSCAGIATFDTPNAGENKSVTVTGLTLIGPAAGNYTLSSTMMTTTGTILEVAAIEPISVTAVVTVADKPYDGTPHATITICTPIGAISGDDVSCGGAATFDSASIGIGKTVSVVDLVLTGGAAANYYLSDTTATTTASIEPISVTAVVTVADKPYDGTTLATLTSCPLIGAISGDDVSCEVDVLDANFDSASIGSGKTVSATDLFLTGAAAANYYLSDTTATATASITQATLIANAAVLTKPYDGTTGAALSSCMLTGVAASDDVSCVGAATFDSANVGTGKTVTVTALTLTGANANTGNYTLANSTTTTTASITAIGVTSVVTVASKTYDGTTGAIITSCVLGARSTAPESISLTWDAHGAEDTVTGYLVSIGTAAGVYTQTVDIGNQTSFVFSNAIPGQAYFFAVAAYNDLGVGLPVETSGYAQPSGVINGDAVTCSGGVATFDTVNVGSGKTVTVSGLSLIGTVAGNYTIVPTATTTAAITARSVTPSVTAANKRYDGTTSATLTSCTLPGAVSGDVGCAGTATFDTASVGAGKTVTATGLALTGTAASNYVLSSTTATTTAAITPQTQVPNDFDGDGRSDPVVFTPSTGTWSILQSSTGTILTVNLGAAGDIPVPADYDGDGRADVAIYHRSTGTWSILTSSSNFSAGISFTLGAATDVPVPGDYDGDGRADIAVFSAATGTWTILKSSSNYSTNVVVNLGANGDTPVPSDYDGDGKADVAVYHPSSGQWQILTSSSNFTTGLTSTWGVSTDLPVPGDYDHDGKTDIAVYRPSTGTWYIQKSSTNFTHGVAYTLGSGADIPVPGDYDGGGQTDLAVYHPSTGTWSVLLSSTGYATGQTLTLGTTADQPVPDIIAFINAMNAVRTDATRATDYDGDGKTDIAVYRPSTGDWAILKSSTGYTTSLATIWGTSTDRPVPGDYDGDGKTDVAVYRPATGTWLVLKSSTNFTTGVTYTLGSRSQVPVPGDYDGDGKTDVAVFAPATGTWTILTSSSNFTATLTVTLGGSLDIPVTGDFDGDGKTDVGVYHPSTGQWQILRSSSNYTTGLTSTWGVSTDLPVPGDYDHDGKTDIAVYRPSTGMWFIQKSSSNFTSGMAYTLGSGADIPVPGDYDGDGQTDLAVYHPGTGTWSVLLSNTSYATGPTLTLGTTADQPVPDVIAFVNAVKAIRSDAIRASDYDGDGKSEIAAYRPSTGGWSILKSSTGYTTSLTAAWGGSTDMSVPGDYDGDGKTDIAVYRRSTGAWYLLKSSTNFTAAVVYTLGTGSDIPVPGDYDGDGKTDIAVFTPTTGTWTVLKSSSNFAASMTMTLGGSLDIPVPGDYDGDGKTDVGVYHPSTGVWQIRTSSSNYTTGPTSTWGVSTDLPVPGDFDGDGKMDIVVYRPSTGQWFVLKSSSGFTSGVTYILGSGDDIPVPGDYDADGQTDLAVYHPSTGTWSVAWSSTGYTTGLTLTLGTSLDRPVPDFIARANAASTIGTDATRASDYDGDGKADIAVYRPSGDWAILLSSGGYTTSLTARWGVSTDVPVPGDFDGDGKTDIAVYRPSTGTWFVLKSSSNFTRGVTYTLGAGSDVPVPGDYDGDGITDVAVYRPSTGAWTILQSKSNFTTVTAFTLGTIGDVPVPGDYDGDGKTDLAVYSPSSGNWQVATASTGYSSGFTILGWGDNTDVPVPGDYDGDRKYDIAIYHPSTATYSVLQSKTGFTVPLALVGTSPGNSVPVVGDFDGDGKVDLAVSTGSVWNILLSGANYSTNLSTPLGAASDRPLPIHP